MDKDQERAEWKRRQALKPKPHAPLHTSKEFTVVKTDTLPQLRFGAGSTYMRLDTIERLKRRRLERQQVRIARQVAKANKTIDMMKSVSDAAELLGTSQHPADT